jgi:hypothetical protein
MQKCFFAFVFTQMSARAGIKNGTRAEAAMMAEYAQMEALLDMYVPVDPKTLTSADKKAALHQGRQIPGLQIFIFNQL